MSENAIELRPSETAEPGEPSLPNFSTLSTLQLVAAVLQFPVRVRLFNDATLATRMRKNVSMERFMSTVGPARLAWFCILSLLFLGRPSYATTFTETGDAGNVPNTAQVTTGVEPLTEIAGTLSPTSGDGQDMYLIHIDGGGTFSATTVGGVAGFDSELFLLGINGKGVYANDDVVGYDAPATLPAGHALTPITSGDYYLAITQCCSEPASAGGQIFPVSDTFNNHNSDVNGPTGAGGALSITGYSGAYEDFPGGGSYRVFLTGAHAAAVVPEPKAFALMLAGLGMVGLFARRRSRTA